MAAGFDSTVVVRSDGKVLAFGGNAMSRPQEGSVPELPRGVSIVQIAAARYFFVNLCSDGEVRIFIPRDDPDDSVGGYGNCTVPELPAGLSYVQVAAGCFHLALLRSDGNVVIGSDDYDEGASHTKNLPELPAGLEYVKVAGGHYVTAMIRSDGRAFVYWHAKNLETAPELPEGATYVDVSAGFGYVLFLRSDGQVTTIGKHVSGATSIPELPKGVTYVQVAAGISDHVGDHCHSVLLRNDGQAVAIGSNSSGQCDIPELPAGLRYVQASAGYVHTVLLRSDGMIVATGDDQYGQCAVPALPEGLRYVPCKDLRKATVVQIAVASRIDQSLEVVCHGLSGDELCRFNVQQGQSGHVLQERLAATLERQAYDLRILLPGAQPLSDLMLDKECAVLFAE
eukprot:TRINITY_DN21775_c0_g1_i1.p1 TRINITY_DN21775_c0_g1~~TRINITY_DN21775_c0_g1_i1.p1  ORF type:complete len:397 (-),score=66.40 TRINITY_DN21775_c0_g1_i1:238-1428(-)